VTIFSAFYDSCHGPKLDTVSTPSSALRPTGQLPVAPASTEEINPAGRDINITWWYTFLSTAGMSVILLGIAALGTTSLIAELDGPTWQTVVVLALFIGSAVSSVYASWLLRDGYGAGWPRRNVTLLLLVIPALGWIVTLFIPGATLYGATPLWITLSIVLPLVQRSHRIGLMAGGLALVVLHGVINPGTEYFIATGRLSYVVLLVLLTPTTFLVSGWLWHLIKRLDDARAVSGQLAVARERLRFASDLHDIQGHHLQVIALKAELADRLLTSTTEKHRQAAQDAIAEVRALAEEAQAETRQLVRDLRVVSLGEELDNAKGVLEAAGIPEVIVETPEAYSPTAEANRLLGFAVREATTNVLRHANASRVCIRLTSQSDQIQLEVDNDGIPHDDPNLRQGTGLDGLRARFQRAGGTIAVKQHNDIFQLRAMLPQRIQENQP